MNISIGDNRLAQLLCALKARDPNLIGLEAETDELARDLSPLLRGLFHTRRINHGIVLEIRFLDCGHWTPPSSFRRDLPL